MPHRIDFFVENNAPQTGFFCEKNAPQSRFISENALQTRFF